MAEYIEREAFIRALNSERVCRKMDGENRHYMQGYLTGLITASIEAKAQPTADVVEVVHGEWKQNSYFQTNYYCSKCGRTVEDGTHKPSVHYPYCHCGAKMDGLTDKKPKISWINLHGGAKMDGKGDAE